MANMVCKYRGKEVGYYTKELGPETTKTSYKLTVFQCEHPGNNGSLCSTHFTGQIPIVLQNVSQVTSLIGCNTCPLKTFNLSSRKPSLFHGPIQVGTCLHYVLSLMGIRPSDLERKSGKNCGCEQMASQMNKWGHEGCLSRLESILDTLQQKAKEHNLFFHRGTAERLVRFCIWRSKRREFALKKLLGLK